MVPNVGILEATCKWNISATEMRIWGKIQYEV